MHIGMDGGGSHVVGLEWSLLLVAIELVDGPPHSIVDPSPLAGLSLARLIATECPLALRRQPLVSFFGNPLFVDSSQELEFLDDQHTATVPDVSQEGDNLSTITLLELEELIHLHRIHSRARLTRISFDDELAQVAHFDEIKVLEVCPPALKGAGDNIAGDEPKFQLGLGLKLSLV